ncbi:MAG: DUF445 family protein [Xanthobacteraceae bacterium]|jgi:uncharacterized membrane-anchored protein YjiN (DUF445 family)
MVKVCSYKEAIRQLGRRIQGLCQKRPITFGRTWNESNWRELEAALQRELLQRAEVITGWALDALASLSRSLDADPVRRERLNDGLRRLLLQIVLPRRAEVGDYIAQVVDRWDTATPVNRLELQVGRDLQYIRINGTLVGGLVGLAIYTITRALGG